MREAVAQLMVRTMLKPIYQVGLSYGALGISLFCLLAFPMPGSAQWKKVMTRHCNRSPSVAIVYFLDLPGPLRIGFMGNEGDVLFKTTDGGFTWRSVMYSEQGRTYSMGDVTDITFKDTLTGWCSTSEGICKTTDGGLTWVYCKGSEYCESFGIYYNKKTKGVFVSNSFRGPSFAGWGCWNLVSWDEGNTWLPVGPPNTTDGTGGFAFADDDNALLSQLYNNNPWLRTTDAGLSWRSLTFNDSATLQPLAIPGTKTYFACTRFASIMRTDDAGDTWTKVFTFPPQPRLPYGIDDATSSGCIRGTLDSLYVMVCSGCYLSTDQGRSWKYLCGQPSPVYPDHRFYVKNNILEVFTAVPGSASNQADYTLWRLNVDSIPYFQAGLTFDDGSKQLNAVPGTIMTVNYRSQENPEVGIGAAHFVFHYDSSLELVALNLPSSWTIVDSVTTYGSLKLTIEDRDSVQLPNPIVKLTFRTVLVSSSAKVYVDTARLDGKRLNCDCLVSSDVERDFVTINFTGCGDSTMLRFMATESPFRIERVVPNPASNSLTVETSATLNCDYALLDVMGREILKGLGAPSFSIDVSDITSGVYFLKVRSEAATATKQITIQH
jgi:photosystem II stability/assembly factor-like uncharacterized protein